MRISDWSSDVCSSDLTKPQRPRLPEETQHDRTPRSHEGKAPLLAMVGKGRQGRVRAPLLDEEPGVPAAHVRRPAGHRSEERRVGKACVSKFRSRWSPDT